MPTPPPSQLIIRLEQIQSPAGSPPADQQIVGGAALYRIVGTEIPICAAHLSELAAYQEKLEARVVLSLDQIEAIVAELGLRRDDLLRLHGPQDPILGEEHCRMCGTLHVEGNVCHDDGCKKPLHPQWPAVYCSRECALNDA